MSGASSRPVTVSIVRHVAPDHAAQMIAWVRAGSSLAERFSGFLGTGWVRPAAESDEWHMLYRFADGASLDAWESSPQRAWWLGSAQGLVGESRLERRTGIEGWFDEPVERDVQDLRRPVSPAPPRWKQAIVIWLTFFPLSLVLGLLVLSTGIDVNIVVRTLITTLVATPIMTYALLPWMTKQFEWFLRPGA
ncbi:MAG: antibiotic biosynthesis monooxygenase [Marmoricola sp.]|nr:antibiotic biosynthesis monooxygenase [Marmoricola sp.]